MNAVTIAAAVADLRDAPENANAMEPERYEMLVRSIQQRGFCQSITVRPLPGAGLEIIDGHHRARAAREAGVDTIPAIMVDGLTEAEVRMLRLSMNRLRGDLDLSTVSRILDEVAASGYLELTDSGFTASEVGDLLEAARGEDEVMPEAVGPPGDAAGEEPTVFMLEIEFGRREDYVLARRALRRAAGKGGQLCDGLLRLIGEEKNE